MSCISLDSLNSDNDLLNLGSRKVDTRTKKVWEHLGDHAFGRQASGRRGSGRDQVKSVVTETLVPKVIAMDAGGRPLPHHETVLPVKDRPTEVEPISH